MTKLIPLLALAVMMTGCSTVPQTVVTVDPSTRAFTIKAPKDVEIEGLTVERNADGVVSFKLDKYRARMNPDIIGAQLLRDKADWEGMQSLIKTGIDSATKKPMP